LLNTVTGVTGPYTAAVVCRPTALGSTNIPLIGGTPTVATSAIRFRSNSGGQLGIYRGVINVISGGGYHPTTTLGWQVIVATFAAAGDPLNRCLVFKDGLSAGTSPNNYLDTNAASGTFINIAAGNFALGGNTYVGEIAEAVLWRSGMSNANKITIGKQLSDLYGVTY
jgi:hypothetical protein